MQGHWRLPSGQDTGDPLTHLVYFTVELVVDASGSQDLTAYLCSLTAALSFTPMSLPNAGFIQQKRVQQRADMAQMWGSQCSGGSPSQGRCGMDQPVWFVFLQHNTEKYSMSSQSAPSRIKSQLLCSAILPNCTVS